MYNENEISLTEATVLALQGKLKLEETRPARRTRRIKNESVEIETDNVEVELEDNGDTTIETDKEIITVSQKTPETDLTSIEEPVEDVADSEETIDVPVEGDETILPEEEVSDEVIDEIVDEPVEDDLEESKKITEDFNSRDMLTWEEWLQEWFENEANRRVKATNTNISNMTEYEIDELDNKLYDEIREDMAAKNDELKKEYEKYIQNYINNADDYIKQLKKKYKKESKKVCEDCKNCEEGKCEENKECLTEEPVKYEWILQGNYGYGWDDLVTYDTKEEAERDYKDYRENEPEYAHRIRKRVVKEETKDLTENVTIEVADDGKEIEVTTDNAENVDVVDTTEELKDSSEVEEIETDIEDIELEESKRVKTEALIGITANDYINEADKNLAIDFIRNCKEFKEVFDEEISDKIKDAIRAGNLTKNRPLGLNIIPILVDILDLDNDVGYWVNPSLAEDMIWYGRTFAPWIFVEGDTNKLAKLKESITEYMNSPRFIEELCKLVSDSNYIIKPNTSKYADDDSIIISIGKDVRESKRVKTEAKQTFNKKSFEETLTKFYKFNNENVKSFKVESIMTNKNGSLKIEGKLNDNVPATMIFDKKIEGKSFITYSLRKSNVLKESKEIKTTMMINKKENILNCRNIISK